MTTCNWLIAIHIIDIMLGTNALSSLSLNSNNLNTLVLNSAYEPIKVISWQKALILGFQNKVDILEYYNYFIHSVSQAHQLPSVMRLKTFYRQKKIHGVRFCRENIYIRDHFTCQYCAIKFPHQELTLDHVLPASQGGPKTWTNVVTACRPCNQRKANRTPEKALMPLMKIPKEPTWLPVIYNQIKPGGAPAQWLQYLRLKIA